MRKLLAYGLIKAGKLIDSIFVTEGKAVVTHSPRSESKPDAWMFPVIRKGVVVGYQDLNSSDNAMYQLVKGGERIG